MTQNSIRTIRLVSASSARNSGGEREYQHISLFTSLLKIKIILNYHIKSVYKAGIIIRCESRYNMLECVSVRV